MLILIAQNTSYFSSGILLLERFGSFGILALAIFWFARWELPASRAHNARQIKLLTENNEKIANDNREATKAITDSYSASVERIQAESHAHITRTAQGHATAYNQVMELVRNMADQEKGKLCPE